MLLVSLLQGLPQMWHTFFITFRSDCIIQYCIPLCFVLSHTHPCFTFSFLIHCNYLPLASDKRIIQKFLFKIMNYCVNMYTVGVMIREIQLCVFCTYQLTQRKGRRLINYRIEPQETVYSRKCKNIHQSAKEKISVWNLKIRNDYLRKKSVQ